METTAETVDIAPCIVCREDVPDPGPDPRNAICDECFEIVQKG